MLPIVDITPFTLQDYPEHTACIIWFLGCNLRCQYCHNYEFLEKNDDLKFIEKDKIFNFLRKRQNLLEGVVFSGGECTLSDEFIDFVEEVKALNFKIKIDTNGLELNTLKILIEKNLVDFIALDFKATKDKFEFITNNNYYDLFEETLKYLIVQNNLGNINLEIRTTVHIDLLDENDVIKILDKLESLDFRSNFYIQNFRNDNKETLYNLPSQSRNFNKKLIDKEYNFNVSFRNFF